MDSNLKDAHGRGYFAWLGFGLALVFMLTGCGSIATEYVAADRATYNAIEPEYRRYVESDATLDDDAKALRLADLDSWDYRLSEAEKAGE